jgi:hypothetical protein
MVVHVSETESKGRRVGRSVCSQGRAIPAFVLVVPLGGAVKPEASVEGGFWPSGIDYSSVAVPAANIDENPVDRLDVLELFDDD